jgi:hypothetical protein
VGLPRSEELFVEQLGYVVDFDRTFGATLWRHDLAVTHRQFEEFFDASVAHPMFALEMCGVGRWDVGEQARHTGDAEKPVSIS